MDTSDIEQDAIYSVSELNNEAKFLLEDTFPSIWVEGEISNFAAPSSGHWYFSLKDSSAQVRCALFRGHQRKIDFKPKDGMFVLVRARVSLYETRGEFQLIADFMEERGEGKLRRAFEALKKKLEAAGLFKEEHKQPLPLFPKTIGVITSATGAAIRDILHVLKRRYACAAIIIYPALVQGSTAAPAIANAIQTANKRKECDVLILARGGGSLEDLWPFNEEVIAHAIYKSKLPIVSGIGHEVDFTIADFVADERAPTPSAAAEIVTPDKEELLDNLADFYRQSVRLCKQKLTSLKQHTNWIEKHLAQQHPKRQLAEKMQKLDFYEISMMQLNARLIQQLKLKLNQFAQLLERQNPFQSIQRTSNSAAMSRQQLEGLIKAALGKQQTLLGTLAARLDTISPLATLKRGYAIASDKDHRVILDAAKLKKGDEITLQLSKGQADCIIEKTFAD